MNMGLLPASGSAGRENHPQRLPGSCCGHPARMVPWDLLGLHSHIPLLPLFPGCSLGQDQRGDDIGEVYLVGLSSATQTWVPGLQGGAGEGHQGVSRAPPHLHRVSPHTHTYTPSNPCALFGISTASSVKAPPADVCTHCSQHSTTFPCRPHRVGTVNILLLGRELRQPRSLLTGPLSLPTRAFSHSLARGVSVAFQSQAKFQFHYLKVGT